MDSECLQQDGSERPKRVTLIVILSLVVPLIALTGFVAREIARGNLPNGSTNYRGSVKDDELWYSALVNKGTPFFPAYEYEIKRLNLKTGVISKTDLPTGSISPPIWVGDTLYTETFGTFHELSGGTLNLLPPVPALREAGFNFEGRLTVVACSKIGENTEFHLTHWEDGKWNTGPRILLPDPFQTWQWDLVTNQPRWAISQTYSGRGLPAQAARLCVVQQGGQYHLLYRSPNNDFVAYRCGFEFAEEELQTVSALECENYPHDPRGWEQLPVDVADWVGEMTCDQQGLLLLGRRADRVFRRHPDGRFSELSMEPNARRNNDWPIIVGDSGSGSYLLLYDYAWSGVKVCPIENDTVKSPLVVFTGNQWNYFFRWSSIIAELFCVWALHICILLAGNHRTTRQTLSVATTDVIRDVRLATPSERAVALLVDGFILYSLLWLAWSLWRLFFFGTQPWGTLPTYDAVTGSLRALEGILEVRNQSYSAYTRAFFGSPLGWIFFPLTPDTGFFGAMMTILVFIGFLYVYFEGFHGITPGKWLLGIRTTTTRLRPCGLARSVVRNVIRSVEVPFGLTPLPAMISLMISDKGQRLGDRLADTVVIKVETPALSACPSSDPLIVSR